MENKQYGVIYKITNLINNKVYIGQTKQKFDKRIYQHKYSMKKHRTYLAKAFRKYGFENFLFEILEKCQKDILDQKEEYYIAVYNSSDENFGYNLIFYKNKKAYYNKHLKQKFKKINNSRKKRLIQKQVGKRSLGKKLSKNKKYVGVNKYGNVWSCQFGSHKVLYFDKEEDAAKMYDIKYIKRTNKIPPNFPQFYQDYIDKKIIVKPRKSKNKNFVKISRKKIGKNNYMARVKIENNDIKRYFVYKKDAVLFANALKNVKTISEFKEVSKNFSFITKRDGKVSKYYGVSYHKRDKVYQVAVNKKYMGSFKTEIEAAKKYDEIVLSMGINTYLNFP